MPVPALNARCSLQSVCTHLWYVDSHENPIRRKKKKHQLLCPFSSQAQNCWMGLLIVEVFLGVCKENSVWSQEVEAAAAISS